MLSQNDLDWFAARLAIAVYDVTRNPEMSVYELREALRGTKGIEDLTLTTAPNGNQVIAIDGKKLEFSPMASNDEIISALQNPFIPTRNTRLTVGIKLQGIGSKLKLLQHNVELDASKLSDAIDAADAKRTEVMPKANAAVATTQKDLAGVEEFIAEIEAATNGAPALTPNHVNG